MRDKYEVGKWYGWNGGECPVHHRTVVSVVEPEGTTYQLQAICFNWGNGVFLFRIDAEYKEPREFYLTHGRVFDTMKEAQIYQGWYPDASESIIHVREVIE